MTGHEGLMRRKFRFKGKRFWGTCFVVLKFRLFVCFGLLRWLYGERHGHSACCIAVFTFGGFLDS